MKKFNCSLIVLCASLLTACGGGGNDAPVVSVSIPPAAILAPIINPFATPLSGLNVSISTSSGDFLVTFSGIGSFTMAGSDNRVFFDANQNGGVMSISGNNNLVVFRINDAASSLTITGTGNTLYLPSGTSITVAGNTGGNTIRYYTPI